MRLNRVLPAAGLGLLAGIAVAATLTHTLQLDFDNAVGTSNNIDTTGDSLALSSLTFSEDDALSSFMWFRSYTDFATVEYQLHAEKDDATFFDIADDCLDNTGSYLSDADTITVNGREYRAGPFVVGGNEASAGGGSLTLDFASGTAGRIVGVQEVRILTSGTHGASASENYVVTFDHDIAVDSVVAAPIAYDTNSSRTASLYGFYEVNDSGLGLAPSGTCGSGYIDEVRFFNDDPGEPTSMTLTWQHDDGIASSWLNGPLAVSVVVDEMAYDGLFSYDGAYQTGGSALDAGANALWHQVDTVTTLNGGAARISVTCSDDGVSFDDPTLYGSPFALAGGSEQNAIFDGTSVTPSQSCAGRYARYTVELVNGFDDATGPVVDSVVLSYEPDADEDGYDPGGVLTTADCDDGDPAISPAGTEIAGNDVDEDCDGVVMCFQDLDGDGQGSAVEIADLDADDDCVSAGESTTNTDCNDVPGNDGADASLGKALDDEDVADPQDNNCDGFVECFADADDDGFGESGSYVNETGGNGCTDVAGDAIGESSVGTDCAGTEAYTFPGAAPNDGGGCMRDEDGDDWGDSSAGGAITAGTDCQDDPGADGADVFPGKAIDDEDVTDLADNDCDGSAECFLDGDDDGFGIAGSYVDAFSGACADVAGDGHNESTLTTDCFDTGASTFPGAAPNDNPAACMRDRDGDDWGDVTAPGTAVAGTDCQDNPAMDGADIFPGKALDDEDVTDLADNDCDGSAECFRDDDDDGFGEPGSYIDAVAATCTVAAGDAILEAILSTDCADTEAYTFPGAAPNDGAGCMRDQDGDDWGDSSAGGAITAGTDCQDNPGSDGADIFPGKPLDNEDVADAADNDCDGSAECFTDADDDGFGIPGSYVDAVGAACNNTAGDGNFESSLSTDCADGSATTFPGAAPNDNALACMRDRDGDDWGDTAPPGTGVPGTDCQDNPASDGADIFPGKALDDEDVADLADNDCDGSAECFRDDDDDGFGEPGSYIDAAGPACVQLAGDAILESTLSTDCADTQNYTFPGAAPNDGAGCMRDQDGDDWGDASAVGAVTPGTDCQDNPASDGADIFPGKPLDDEDVGDLADNDCDGSAECFLDNDDDGFGVAGSYIDAVGATCNNTPGDGNDESSLSTDCNDSGATTFPGAAPNDNPTACMRDRDGDNWGDIAPPGGVTPGTDCQDAPGLDGADIFPGKALDDEDVADLADNDCDGAAECFRDDDDDGFGEPGSYIDAVAATCNNTVGDAILESTFSTDCRDTESFTFPGAAQIENPTACMRDQDDDGWGDDGPPATVVAGTDCNDAPGADGADAYPGKVLDNEDVTDLQDNDCDGSAECFADADDDGVGVLGVFVDESATDGDAVCSNIAGNGHLESTRGDDCDDTLNTVSPLLIDICGDGLDNNCDGNGNFATPGPGGFLDDDGDGVLYDDEVSAGTDDCAGDSDSDGVADNDELYQTFTDPLDPDSDGDGLLDGYEVGGDPSNALDTDGDGLIDALDDDDDDDSVLTIDEDPNNTGDPRDDDTDGDGAPNYLDDDDDEDGLPTLTEVYGANTDPLLEDTDGDTIPDFLESDDDDDGILTAEELVDDPADLDGDGLPGYRDLDSDQDGWSDDHEYTTSPALDHDTDGDGDRDHVDFDSDDDNVEDLDELGDEGLPLPARDTDGDGLEDRVDEDDDDDLVLTSVEAYFGNTDPLAEDTDGDNTPDFLDSDDDDDQVPTREERYGAVTDPTLQQTDGDGIPDYRDDDDDGDTVLTLDEDLDNNGDPRNDNTDGDALPNYRDPDDDGDSVLTANESPDLDGDPLDDDTDGDGINDWLDDDDDNDLIPTSTEAAATPDPDGDGIPNHLDTDSDDDGWSDQYEFANGGGPLRDSDGDGDADQVDLDSDGDNVGDIDELGNEAAPGDTDGDLIPDRLDPDDDGDTVPTIDESWDANSDPLDDDTDNDTIPNFLDDDDDGDTVLTIDESPDGDGDPRNDDTDGDGILDHLDDDDDGDGLATALEDPDGTGGVATDDNDGDSIPNYLDDDDDGDNVPTLDEDVDGSGDPRDDDTNGDLLPDYLDDDDDGDGLPTATEAYAPNTDPLLEDTDGDSIPDFRDDDDDGDDVLTFNEAYLPNTDPRFEDTDADAIPDYLDDDDDGDTVPTRVEAYLPNTDPMLQNTDADGIPDYLDDDDDQDGVPTEQEDVVSVDGDPTNDNTDGDALPNYRDPDDDGDSILTINEDLDSNGQPHVGSDDFDGDGIDDWLDADDDNDTIPTFWERSFLVNHHATDSDADGETDGEEWFNSIGGLPDLLGGYSGTAFDDPWDRDSDTIINPLDGDDDGDGLQSLFEPHIDSECAGPADGIPSFLDFDSDGDGIDDLTEGDGDDDGDYIPNFLDCDGSGCLGDTDNDGLPNCRDVNLSNGDVLAALNPDVDGDGVIDGDEVGTDPNCFDPDLAVVCTPLNTDGDGLIDILDPDDDGDGFPTLDELAPDCPGVVALNPTTLQVTCDGVAVSTLENTDADVGQPLPLTPDTIPDYLDPDDDGDGKPSLIEGAGDIDGDGLVNYRDPDDSSGPLGDSDQDGISNGDELLIGSDPFSEDSDGDTIPDGQEVGDPGNPRDTDQDGIPDILDPDDDGDGIPSADEGISDPDHDGLPNYLDRDRDGDGIDDDVESQTEDEDCDGVVDIDDANPLDGPCSQIDTGLSKGEQITNGGCACSGTGSTPVGGLWLLALAAVALRRRANP